MWLMWLPPALVIVAAGFLVAKPGGVAESPVVLTTLNTLLVVATSLAVAYLAAHTYLQTAERAMLALGCAALSLGVIYLLVGPLVTTSIDAALVLHNGGLLVTAALFVVSAVWFVTDKPRRTGAPGRPLWIVLLYAATMVALALLTWAALAGVTPAFFVTGDGVTAVRQGVLAFATAEFVAAALLLRWSYRRTRLRFLGWYSIALAMFALGLGTVWLGEPGSAISWLGRVAQFAAGAYMLVAILAAVRESGGWSITLSRALWESEVRFRSMFESMTEGAALHELVYDGHRAVDYRVLDVNPSFEDHTGIEVEAARDRLASDLYGTREAPYLREYGKVVESGEPCSFETYFEPLQRSFKITAVALQGGHFATFFEDITERKHSEEALRRQAEMIELSFDAIMVWQPGGTIESWNRGAEELYGFSRAEALGQVGHDLLATIHERPWPQIEATLREQGSWEGEVRHHAKDGREMVVSSRLQLIRGGDGVDRILETNRDITEHRLAEVERELLLEAASALNRPIALADVLDTLARITLEVGGHSRVVISLWQEEPGRLTVARSRGDAALMDGMTVAISDLSAPARQAIEMHETLVIDYDALEPGRRGMGDRYTSHLALDVPLVFGGRFVGLLATDDPGERREFSARQIRLIQGIAAHAAVAIENARFYEAETAAQMRRAAEEERNRLARDLHDSVTQALFAATLKAEALTMTDDPLPGGASRVADEVRRLNRGALAQMRTLLLELRGEPLEGVPIGQLLRHLIEAAEGRSSARIQLAIRGDAQLPPRLHVAIYRITQEALNNVTRHARASKAWVDLDAEPGRVHLTVRDDGCGFEPSACDATHMGLTSMRERSEEAGARFEIVTQPGGGTTIVADWPDHQDVQAAPPVRCAGGSSA